MRGCVAKRLRHLERPVSPINRESSDGFLDKYSKIKFITSRAI
jgi:hypothetical protein